MTNIATTTTPIHQPLNEGETTVPVTVKLPPRMFERLTTIAAEREESRSALVRDMITRWLNAND